MIRNVWELKTVKRIKFYAAISLLVGGLSLTTCSSRGDEKIYDSFSETIDFDYERSLAVPDKIEQIGEKLKEKEQEKIHEKVARMVFDEYVGNDKLLDSQAFKEIENIDISWNAGRNCFEVRMKSENDNYCLRFDEDHVSLIGYMINQINCKNIYIDAIDNMDLYEALASCVNLQGLSLSNSHINDLSFMANMTNLARLTIENCPNIRDITSLEKMTNLIYLTINGTNVEDVTPLVGLTNLKQANLRCNKIKNPDILASLPKLDTLFLEYNEITNILQLNHLREKNILTDNEIKGIIDSYSEDSVIFKGEDYQARTKNVLVTYYDALEQYFVELIDDENSLCGYSLFKEPPFINAATEELEKCTGISFINCKDDDIVAWLPNADNYKQLAIDHCEFNDLRFVNNFKNLNYFGVEDSQVKENIQAYFNSRNFKDLKTISIDNTNIEDMNTLRGNENIEQVELRYNEIDDFEFLTTLPNLKVASLTVDDDNHPVDVIQTLIENGTVVVVNDVVVDKNNFDSIYKIVVGKRYTK